MVAWAAIGAGASMLSGILGQKSASDSTIEGAESQANIEKYKRDYLTKIFDEDIERQKPFYEAGKRAGVLYADAVTNKLDPTRSGAYQMQKNLIEPDLVDAPEYVREGAMSRLGAVEGEAQKGRLLDLQQIGMGASRSAGTSSLNLGSMLASSYGLSGNVMTGGTQSYDEGKQSMWNTTMTQLGGLPSYFAADSGGETYGKTYTGPSYSGKTVSNPKGLTPGGGL